MVPTVPETETPFRTTTPSAPAMRAMTAKQVDSVHVHALPVQNTSQSEPPAHCAHVHKLLRQVLKPGDSLALSKVQHLHNGRTPSCFEGIERFPGEPYKFHLKPEHKPARYAPRKVPILLEDAFKKEVKSLVKLAF